ncbi:MAG TPA: CRISPR-associated helicase Cas3' [Rhodocyclaceae bacterium]|nr:CRISPR-associated helicase Cas3' [Rhodocyclaceae bacterium]
MDEGYFHYWGKADPHYAGEPKWHPLVFHCLDVAAVGVEYLRCAPAQRRLFVQALGHDEGLDGWIAFWLALHDVGKLSEAFQGQRADLFQALRGRPPGKAYTLRHDSLGWLLWQELIGPQAGAEQWFGPQSDAYRDGLDCWMRAVTGHHGQPPLSGGFWKTHCHRQEDPAAIADAVTALRLLLLDEAASQVPSRLGAEHFAEISRDLSWWLAGLAVLADWIGSNTRYFPYRNSDQSSAEYWQCARRQAAFALSDCGVLPVHSRGELPFVELFPDIAQPSPLQRWVADLDLPTGPQIHLLEDVTGAGKTEAAVMLAHRLMAQGQADGFFIGLPTMATANAMYGRIAAVYARLFEGDASLALAHGNRGFVEAFARSVLPPVTAEHDSAQQDETASARCAAWLADHNKRALLAPAGVGTLDQALLAVLQSRHQSLRLLGLSHKVLLVDEVHACDAYMLGVLCVLLQFHARAGGSAILLSATLPSAMKRKLLAAFARGREHTNIPALTQMAYPLATTWYAEAPHRIYEIPLDTRPSVRRTVAVRAVADQEALIDTILSALDAGRCVCWIRNTVADALDAFELFRDRIPDERLMLFHARFALCDRLDIEARVLTQFGPESGPAERAGRLLLATQVVEQSLDLDFDLLVTDLAPIARVIQRAGRLCRHVRDQAGRRLMVPEATDGRGSPCLWIYGPAWTETPAGDWFKRTFPKAAAVYPDHGQLWLTAQALRRGSIAMPQDARALIEGVFGEAAEIPEGLQRSADRAQAQGYADASQAQANTLTFEAGYSADGTDWWSEARTPSRLGEPSINVVLARWDGDSLKPWADHDDPRQAWAYSAVRVAERLIARAVEPESPARKTAIEAVRDTLPGQGRWSVLLPLEETSNGWVAPAWAMPRAGHEEPPMLWCYDRLTGLGPNKMTADQEDE